MLAPDGRRKLANFLAHVLPAMEGRLENLALYGRCHIVGDGTRASQIGGTGRLADRLPTGANFSASPSATL